MNSADAVWLAYLCKIAARVKNATGTTISAMPQLDDALRARLAEMITEIETSTFRETKWGRRGYRERDVDDFLDYVIDVVLSLLSIDEDASAVDQAAPSEPEKATVAVAEPESDSPPESPPAAEPVAEPAGATGDAPAAASGRDGESAATETAAEPEAEAQPAAPDEPAESESTEPAPAREAPRVRVRTAHDSQPEIDGKVLVDDKPADAPKPPPVAPPSPPPPPPWAGDDGEQA